jgi:hypothetical protein
VGGDCGPTLAANATFDTDISRWTAEFDASIEWQLKDWEMTQDSGSALVVNANAADAGGLATSGAAQCIPVGPFQAYEVSARAFIPGGQGSGSAAINVWTFQDEGCKGTLLVSNMSSSTLDVNEWTLLSGRVSTPARSKSMLVRLVAIKPFRQKSLGVWFDAIGVYAL